MEFDHRTAVDWLSSGGANMSGSELSASVEAGTGSGSGSHAGVPAEASAVRAAERLARGGALWTALGEMLLAELGSDAQIRAARALGERNRTASFYLYLQLDGQGVVRQDGRHATLGCGDFVLCDGGRHFDLIPGANGRMLVLIIPTGKLRRHIACPESLVALAMEGASGVGGLLSGFLRQLCAQTLPARDGAGTEQIAGAILELLGAAYAQVPRTHAERSSRGTAHRIRIINYIHAHLYDPDLTPAQIASACRITTRYLHYLFSDGDETVTRYILKRRLEACSQALLADSQHGRTVTAIAFDHGFNSATHFGRVFRSHFGMTPREFRARGVRRTTMRGESMRVAVSAAAGY